MMRCIFHYFGALNFLRCSNSVVPLPLPTTPTRPDSVDRKMLSRPLRRLDIDPWTLVPRMPLLNDCHEFIFSLRSLVISACRLALLIARTRLRFLSRSASESSGWMASLSGICFNCTLRATLNAAEFQRSLWEWKGFIRSDCCGSTTAAIGSSGAAAACAGAGA